MQPGRERWSGWLVAALVGTSLVGVSARPAVPSLVWNLTPSAPVGLYLCCEALPLGRSGDLVLVRAPQAARQLAQARGYIPMTTPLIKRLAAGPGDHVCGLGQALFVNGKVVATRKVNDAMGRPLPWWSGCLILKPDQRLVLGDVAGSFDGRYFGPSAASDISGILRPVGPRGGR